MDANNPDSEIAQHTPIPAPYPRTPKSKPPVPPVDPPDHDVADSGYATGSTNTPGPHSQEASHCPRPSRPVPGTSEHGDLYRFDHLVPLKTIELYKRISAQLEPELVQYVRKHFRTHSPIVIRLMVLGRKVDEAMPWLVVFCDKERSSCIRRFFRKNFSRILKQSGNALELCSKALILPLGVQLLNSTTPIVSTSRSYISDTLCGAPVVVWSRQSEPEEASRQLHATIGGLIKIGTADGDFELFGFTAAHVLSSPMPTHPDPSEQASLDFPSEDDSSDDDSSANEGVWSRSPSEEADLPVNDIPVNTRFTADDLRDKALGEMSSRSIAEFDDDTSIGMCCSELDYALFKIFFKSDLRPNRLRKGRFGISRETDLVKTNSTLSMSTSDRDVVLNICSEEAVGALLLSLPCSMWLNGSGKFVQAQALEMKETSGLFPGDSGAWVVEAHTSKVYGHLIASDSMGDGYMISLHDTLESIRDATGADVVDLATSIDVACKRGVVGPSEGSSTVGAIYCPCLNSPTCCDMSIDLELEPDVFGPIDIDHGIYSMQLTDCLHVDSGYNSCPVTPESALQRTEARAIEQEDAQDQFVGSDDYNDDKDEWGYMPDDLESNPDNSEGLSTSFLDAMNDDDVLSVQLEPSSDSKSRLSNWDRSFVRSRSVPSVFVGEADETRHFKGKPLPLL